MHPQLQEDFQHKYNIIRNTPFPCIDISQIARTTANKAYPTVQFEHLMRKRDRQLLDDSFYILSLSQLFNDILQQNPDLK